MASLEDVLGFPGYKVVDVEIGAGYVFHIEEANEAPVCPECGASGNLIKFDGYNDINLKDIPIMGHPSVVNYRAHRCYCTRCLQKDPQQKKKVFTMPIDVIAPKKAQITNRLKNMVANEKLMKLTFKAVAERYFLTRNTVKSVLMQKCEALDRKVTYDAVRCLGIDEAHLANDMRGVLVDGSDASCSKLVDILPDRKQATIIDALHRIRGGKPVEFATMDMCVPYREAVLDVFPHCKVIVDKFHVLSALNKATEQARKNGCYYYEAERALLRGDARAEAERLWKSKGINHYWFKKRASNLTDSQARRLGSLVQDYPVFGDVYRIKEMFYDLYDLKTRAEAEKAYDEWKNEFPSQPNNVLYPFYEFSQTVDRWREWIFNYFDAPDEVCRTNAATEAINGVIKEVNRAGKGYDFDVLRAKVLYGNAPVRVEVGGIIVPLGESYYRALEMAKHFTLTTAAACDVEVILLEALATNPDAETKFTFLSSVVTEMASGSYSIISEYLSNTEFYQMMEDTAISLDGDYKTHFTRMVRPSIPIDTVISFLSLVNDQILLGEEDEDELIPYNPAPDEEPEENE